MTPRFKGTGSRIRLPVRLALLVAVVAGCHTYQPVENGVPDPGASVRVELEDCAERDRAGCDVARSDELVGSVLRHTGDSLVLSVRDRMAPGAVPSTYRDTIAVPTFLVRGIEEEKLSVWRSAALTAGVVTGTFLMLELGVFEAGGGNQPPPGQNPVESRWPNR